MTAREWLQKAKEEHFAIGAFNVGNLETFKAIVEAALLKRSPVIIESSPGETKWLEANNITDLARNYSEEYGIPILVNLDHANSLEECKIGIEAGYDLIHYDGSKFPFTENVKIAQQVVELAHAKNLLVEGEFDHIAGSSEVHSGSAAAEIANVSMTDPQQALSFVQQTGVDILAAFFGNVHGVFTQGGENLDIPRLQHIAQTTNIYLSLHGGSGIPDEQVKQAISAGIVKVNINTEMRQAFRNSLETSLKNNPQEYAMYKLEESVVQSVRTVVEHKIDVFGSGGKA